jgi:cobalamin biosynthesis protein CobD/CbiB
MPYILQFHRIDSRSQQPWFQMHPSAVVGLQIRAGFREKFVQRFRQRLLLSGFWGSILFDLVFVLIIFIEHFVLKHFVLFFFFLNAYMRLWVIQWRLLLQNGLVWGVRTKSIFEQRTRACALFDRNSRKKVAIFAGVWSLWTISDAWKFSIWKIL